jgi:hypothetical protein
MSESYESITVSSAAIGLTAGTITPIIAGVRNATALCVVETAQIRYRVDGTDPTSSEGIALNIGDTLVLEGSDDLLKFRAIRTGGTDAVLKCSYGKK